MSIAAPRPANVRDLRTAREQEGAVPVWGVERPMRRYFFDSSDNKEIVLDVEGIDCASEASAMLQATIGLAELARDVLPGRGPCRLAIFVRNDEGRRVGEARIEFTIG